ncbi:UDP-N-acetylmuramate--L-alanine ligase [Candidatus Beckwithbacteria bacterium RBG_13_42_9]|uniref:UDP-N-acetylmuramate--L-alanine ligase n=1 Tax=Candidatus Beckwithbacteria bacterium RBG_13_42_9 TaxID=1797457 RepID=A0A1F5E7A7_9BACT|nr:MAG: UDP-N-acetylmuramate--L-alanine ligase [Candidatus Beckwithbacteria bacterium RBG_13_42_9]
MDLNKIKHIHFTGIRGVGMTALACLAVDFRMEVNGSDLEEKFVTEDALNKKGIPVYNGFSKGNIARSMPDLLVYGAAHGGEDNVEVQAARALKIPTLSQGEVLGLFYNTKKGISVAGVGGKTTTTGMLATILGDAGKHPSYMVGAGKISSLVFPGKYDRKGEWFISEADEYVCSPQNKRPKFYYQQPKIVILPSLAYDHPDIYQNAKETLRIFKAFVEKIPPDGVLVANVESPMVRQLLDQIKIKGRIITYGENRGDGRVKKYQANKEKIKFQIVCRNHIRPFILSIPGKINVLNATAAILTAEFLGLTDVEIQSGLLEFTGVSRRFEKIYEEDGSVLYDDYAHHPEEIKATLKIAKEWLLAKRLIVIFQPHTYSRTKALLNDFAQSFQDADKVIITEIFASAREKETLGINGQLLADKVKENHSQVEFCATLGDTITHLRKENLDKTAILTLGAGDIFLWHEKLIDLIKQKEKR